LIEQAKMAFYPGEAALHYNDQFKRKT